MVAAYSYLGRLTTTHSHLTPSPNTLMVLGQGLAQGEHLSPLSVSMWSQFQGEKHLKRANMAPITGAILIILGGLVPVPFPTTRTHPNSTGSTALAIEDFSPKACLILSKPLSYHLSAPFDLPKSFSLWFTLRVCHFAVLLFVLNLTSIVDVILKNFLETVLKVLELKNRVVGNRNSVWGCWAAFVFWGQAWSILNYSSCRFAVTFRSSDFFLS